MFKKLRERIYNRHIEKELADNNEKNNPDLEAYKDELRIGKYRNVDRIKDVYVENGYTFE